MREQAMRLYSAVTYIDDALIEEAQADAPRKGSRIRLRWAAVAACLLLAVGFGAARLARAPRGNEGAAVPLESSGTMPGGIRPVLRVGDTLYLWMRLSDSYYYPDGTVVTEYVRGPGDNYIGGGLNLLPAGYEPIGELSGVTAEEPDEDFELQAGFEATGVVYAHPDYPQNVIVCVTTDWMPGVYVRFDARESGKATDFTRSASASSAPAYRSAASSSFGSPPS